MNSLRKKTLPVLFASALFALVGCTSDSPSEPRPNPQPPVPPVPITTYNVTVAVSPASLQVGSTTSSTVTVNARRSDNNAAPSNGTTLTLTTTLGSFGSSGSGLRQQELQLVNGQAQTVLFAGTDSGTATVRATLDQSSGFANVSISSSPTFFVAFVNPGVGDVAGGEEVTIQGGGFDGPVRVTFGNANAQVISVAPDRIRVRTPSAQSSGVNPPVGSSSPVSVTVTINVNETNQAVDSLTNGFTFAHGGGGIDQPQVFSVTPASGTNDGGTPVTINGSGFVSPVQVFFEGGSPRIGVEATVQSVTSTRIVVLSPAARGFGQGLQNQTADVRVKNVNSGNETTSRGAFRFGSNVLITAVGPTDVIYNVPTEVVIQGQGFDEPLTVTLAGIAAGVTSVTGTRIVARSPIAAINNCTDVMGSVGVLNIETGDADDTTGQIVFRFRPIRPVITSINPVSGPGAGGTQVTIGGAVSAFQGFDPPVRVLVNGVPATIVSVAPGQIVIRTPQFTGTFPTQPCTVGTETGTMMVPAVVPIIVTNLNTACSETLNNAFSYTPANSSCVIQPPARPVASFTFTRNNLTAIFTDTSSGNPFAWSWNFGDPGSGGNNTSNLQNPTHIFSGPGVYTVSLTATNGGGAASTTQFVTVP